jgi:hypothetical protein
MNLLEIPQRLRPVVSFTLILEHACILAHIIALDLQSRLRRDGLEDKVVVAVGAVLVALVKLLDVLAEALFALFAGKHHFERGLEVVLFRLGVAFCAVEPFLAFLMGRDRGQRGSKKKMKKKE